MELLPYVLVEDILLRLPVKTLLKFTSVSREWNSRIKTQDFASKHLIRTQLRNPDILLCGAQYHDDDDEDDEKTYSYLRTLMLGSSDSEKIHVLPKPNRCYGITVSCDGLVCAYNLTTLIYVINPATRWYRSLPRSKLQQVNHIRRNLNHKYIPISCLGFGKDISTGKYKVVWLYNSFDVDLRGPTTCEVYDFNSNTWRYITGATHRICDRPVYADGSLYWFTEGEIKILCFDLQTEVFQVMSETPIINAFPHNVIMCSLNSRLCVSEVKGNTQEIWKKTSNETWEKIFTINLGIASSWFGEPIRPITPVAIFDDEKLILHENCAKHPGLVVQDTRLDTYCLYLSVSHLDRAVSYLPSLIFI